MKRLASRVVWAMMLAAAPAALGQLEKGEILTENEEDKLRDAQDPSQRIEIYLAFAEERLDRFEGSRSKPTNPNEDTGAYLNALLNQYIGINDELKNWIDDQYQRNGDMRRGLRDLLQLGQQQEDRLRRIEETPDAFSANYRDALRDAKDDLDDTLEGAAKALTDQEKKLGELKREEKATERSIKERAKEERKQTKEEKKLLKKERKRHHPIESDED